MAEASVVSFRTFETIQELTGTTVCKRGQIAALRTFAIENDCWYADASVFGEFSDRGSVLLVIRDSNEQRFIGW